MDLKRQFDRIKHHLNSSKDVANIMLPLLKKHEITVFNFCREYPDGSYIRLSSHNDWNEHYFKKGYAFKRDKVPKSYLIKPLNYFIWLPTEWPEMMIDAAQNFNIANGISLAERHDEYVDFYCFGASANNFSIINNFYLPNLELLLKYGHYFKNAASILIDNFEKDKIILSSTNETSDSTYPSNQYLAKLSKRQIQCANLLLEGNNTRQIAAFLDLSPRTIESYIDHLKIKLNCFSKTELIIKLNNLKMTLSLL